MANRKKEPAEEETAEKWKPQISANLTLIFSFVPGPLSLVSSISARLARISGLLPPGCPCLLGLSPGVSLRCVPMGILNALNRAGFPGCLLATAAAAFLLSGCATGDVNPSRPRPNTGYVDFQADAGPMCWDVSRFDAASGQYKSVFWDMTPVKSGVLRLPFPPGTHRLQIGIPDRAVENPVEIEVPVQDGKITPVRVTTSGVGTVTSEGKALGWGQTVKSPAGRRVRIRAGEAEIYTITAAAGEPVEYRRK